MKSCLQVRALLECKSARALTPGDLWYPLICSCKSCDSPACAAKCWDRFFPRNSAVGGSAFPHINRTSLPLPPFPRRLVHTLLPDRDKSEPKSPDPSPFSRLRSRCCCSHRILFLFVALDFKEWLIEGSGGIGEYQSKLFKPHSRDSRSHILRSNSLPREDTAITRTNLHYETSAARIEFPLWMVWSGRNLDDGFPARRASGAHRKLFG